LSYTTFRYSDLDIDKGNDDGRIRVSFQLTNTGKSAGAEIAELYVAPVNPPVVRPIKELKGFTKVYLAPGESKKVTIALDRRSLAYYDVSSHAWDVARDSYNILVGSSSQDIRLQGSVVNLLPVSLSVLDSSPVPVRNGD
jgi:beta-glucosidase